MKLDVPASNNMVDHSFKFHGCLDSVFTSVLPFRNPQLGGDSAKHHDTSVVFSVTISLTSKIFQRNYDMKKCGKMIILLQYYCIR
jgi:hypothetical protein